MSDIDNSLPVLKRRAEIAASRGNEDALVAVEALEAALAKTAEMKSLGNSVLATMPNAPTGISLVTWAELIEHQVADVLA